MKKIQLSLLGVALVMLSSCSKLGDMKADFYTVTPELLEATNGEVPVTIAGTFPEKYFNKKAVVTVTPVLRWEGGSVSAEPYTLRGEKVEGNEKMIVYKEGGSFSMKSSFDYVPEMAKSELFLEFTAKLGKKTKTLPAVKVADGVLATAELYAQTTKSTAPAYAEDAFQRVIEQAKQANIMFLIQQANLRWSETNSDDMKAFYNSIAEIDADKKGHAISNVEVSAYASPDGALDLNDRLASQRQKNAEKEVNKQLKKKKVATNVDTEYTAEDWEGFKELVEGSNIPDKDLILRVLSMYNEPEEREAEIKNISTVYKELADNILPQLRRARLTLNYQLIGRSDEEIMEAVKSDASVLNVEELLYAATLTESVNEKMAIYQKTAQLFPNEYRTFNNMADLAMQAGDYKSAEKFLNQAAKLNNGSAEVNTNLGMLALAEGNVAEAEAYLVKGTDAKANSAALGNLYIAQGQYQKAVNAFGDTKSNAAALAQIMAKDYASAKSTLAAVKNVDAYTYYLTAIVGARTNNASMVSSNLAKAVKMDASLRDMAKKDVEFAKFADSLMNL